VRSDGFIGGTVGQSPRFSSNSDPLANSRSLLDSASPDYITPSDAPFRVASPALLPLLSLSLPGGIAIHEEDGVGDWTLVYSRFSVRV
jgi:hypothetical protein